MTGCGSIRSFSQSISDDESFRPAGVLLLVPTKLAKSQTQLSQATPSSDRNLLGEENLTLATDDLSDSSGIAAIDLNNRAEWVEESALIG